jgi:iron complex transport system ATP-binding protein
MKIKIEGLEFSYNQKSVLQDINIEVNEGEIMVLVGPNGSGKTTLLKNIGGVLKPAKGAVYLDMQRLSMLSPKEIATHIAAVDQEHEVGFDFTVLELVEMGRTPHLGRLERLGERDIEAIRRAMSITDTATFSTRPLNELSGGEKQRVFLAIALAQEPQVLLLDEPTANLDVKYQIEIMDTIKTLACDGLTVIAAIHDLNIAANYADRIALINDGQLIATGNPQDVLTEENIAKVFHVRAVVKRDLITNSFYIIPSRQRLPHLSEVLGP